MRERDTGGGYVASRGRRAHDHEKNACKYVKPFTPTNETNVKKKENTPKWREKEQRGCAYVVRECVRPCERVNRMRVQGRGLKREKRRIREWVGHAEGIQEGGRKGREWRRTVEGEENRGGGRVRMVGEGDER